MILDLRAVKTVQCLVSLKGDDLVLWVDATDLKGWAARRDCQTNLPLLIRRLVRATATDISHILFPAGDSVSSPGWDGTLKVSDGTEYIPEGISIWEMGCNQNVKGKADKDYEKRKESISVSDASEITYVFVSPRAWTKSNEWCEEKREEGFWKDVKAYNAATLEEWIEQAPAVGIWLGQLLGKYPEGVKALEDWWNEWKMGTVPPFTKELVLAGRDDQVRKVQEMLKFSSSQIIVQAATINESIAFLAAAINSLPEEEREFYISRSIIIKDSEAFNHISISSSNELLFIPEFEEIEGLSLAKSKGHCVYIPVGPDNVANSDIVLPRLGRDAFISAIREMGLSEENAQKYSRDTGRSLTVLRRQLASYSNRAEWAKAESARDIIPALLIGRWDESNNADKEIVGRIARDSYDSFATQLYLWQHQPDSPVLNIGRLWRLLSPMDAFFALIPFITPDDLQQFKEIVLEVLSSPDPTLELEPEKRWMSAIYGKVPKYSINLRKGIIQTLILIGVFGDNAKISLSISAQTWVDNIIRELLQDADCNLWNSLSDVLPLIAEASPVSFMDAVESSLSVEEKPIMCLFGEVEGIMGPSSNHSSLLWALEGLAWSSELLSRVTIILGKLGMYDPNPESRMINRPKNSLREIFLLWRPQTDASLEERLEVLDVLIERNPEIGWDLLIELMPKNHDIGRPISKTVWRQLSEKTELRVTMAERYKSVEEVIDRLLTHVGYDGQRWIKMLDNFPALPVDGRKRIIEQLSSDVNEISEGRYGLWNKLRKIISRHRSYPETDWALPEDELRDLELIYLSLEPDDTIDRLCWLFDGMPDLLEGVKKEDRHDDEHFLQLRLDALNDIRNDYGFEGLIRLAERIKYPSFLGRTLAEDNMDPIEEEKLYSLLEESDESTMVFVKEYIFRKSFNDEEWIKNLVEKAQTEKWPDLKVVNCFTAFPSRMVVWDLLKSLDNKIQKSYWEKCGFGGITKASEDKIYYLKEIVKVKRYFTALDIAALYSEEIPPDLIAEILEKAATDESLDELRIENYDIEKLFEQLYESGYPEDEIAKLEWFYLKFLASVGSQRSPKMLHNELARNPEFFSEVIRNAYTRKDGNKEDDHEELSPELLEQRAHLSFELLHSWNSVPGSENGQIDREVLKSWIDNARELCEESDRIEVCDVHIGGLLALAESEEDIWPPEAVCDIIETISSEDLHNGFRIGISNSRGVFTKSLDEGGKQEIALCKKYKEYADKLNTRFPITAAILYGIAEDYKEQAKREDEEVERRDLEY